MPQKVATGYQQLTVSTTSVSCTVPSPNNTRYAFIRCETANVRYRDDGTAPTSSVGTPLNAGETMEYDADPGKLQFIRSGGSDATLDINYYQTPGQPTR